MEGKYFLKKFKKSSRPAGFCRGAARSLVNTWTCAGRREQKDRGQQAGLGSHVDAVLTQLLRRHQEGLGAQITGPSEADTRGVRERCTGLPSLPKAISQPSGKRQEDLVLVMAGGTSCGVNIGQVTFICQDARLLHPPTALQRKSFSASF